MDANKPADSPVQPTTQKELPPPQLGAGPVLRKEDYYKSIQDECKAAAGSTGRRSRLLSD
jgi:hypothetical protein